MRHHSKKQRKRLPIAVAAAWLIVVGAAIPVSAQDDVNNLPNANNVPTAPKDAQLPDMPGPVKAQLPGVQQREQKMRELMAEFGVAEPAIQDAVIAYMASEAMAQRPLRLQGRRLIIALKAQAADANAVTDDQMRVLVADFRVALDADLERTMEAEAALDNQIGYSKNPRLEAMLVLLGIIGNGPPMMIVGGPGQPNGAPLGPNNNNILTPRERHERREAMVRQFDRNGDGKLNQQERAEANAFARGPQKQVAAASVAQPVKDAAKPAAKDIEDGAAVEGDGPEMQPTTPPPVDAPDDD